MHLGLWAKFSNFDWPRDFSARLLGSLIEDKYKLFNHGTFMARNRTIAFSDVSEINEKQLAEYIRQAMKNNRAGKKVKIKSRDKSDFEIPKSINDELIKNGLIEKFNQRPPYQRRDYIHWVTTAKLPETRKKRLSQMIDELFDGGLYMGMAWRDQTSSNNESISRGKK